jgi:AraC-like DNA-binding protein
MNEVNPPNTDRLQTVLNSLNSHYLTLDFTTKTWANQLNMSEAYLSRFLREQTGKPASAHLRDKRMARAKGLLADTNDSIISIATASGFNDNNYFSRKFKECEGVSPTEWRELYTKKGKF